MYKFWQHAKIRRITFHIWIQKSEEELYTYGFLYKSSLFLWKEYWLSCKYVTEDPCNWSFAFNTVIQNANTVWNSNLISYGICSWYMIHARRGLGKRTRNTKIVQRNLVPLVPTFYFHRLLEKDFKTSYSWKMILILCKIY